MDLPEHERILGCPNFMLSSTTSRQSLPVTRWKLLGAFNSIHAGAKTQRQFQSGILPHILAIVDVRSVASDQQVRGREQCAPGSSRHEDGLWLAAERSSDRTKRLEAVKHRQRRERFNTFITLLGQEMKEQTASRSFTIKRLAKEKNHWFSHSE